MGGCGAADSLTGTDEEGVFGLWAQCRSTSESSIGDEAGNDSGCLGHSGA